MSKYVMRRVVTALKTDGQPYTQYAARSRREQQLLHRVAAPRKGEKIVGDVCEYQTGVHMRPNHYGRMADVLADMRSQIANSTFGPMSSANYCENVIDKTLAEARRYSI